MLPPWAMLLPAALAAGEASDGPTAEGGEVVVEEDAAQPSASSRTLDRAAIEAMPARSAGDLLRAMPGLHQSAHGGHGKAYQYFLRGFDAVHGADLAVRVDDVPVNEVSNVHAHGYLDLHFLPSQLVQGVELRPGSASAESGDFGIAGSARFHLGLERPGGVVTVGGGTDRSVEGSLAWRPAESAPGTFVVADVDVGQGVGMARDWRQLRGGAGVEGSLGEVRARAWLLAYEGRFASPGALREDDVLSGALGFYDAYPGSGGGRSQRVLGAVQLSGGDGDRAWRTTAWAGLRALSLQQNFTGWHGDAVHGDGSLQTHGAGSGGVSARGFRALSESLSLAGGAEARLDLIDQTESAARADGSVRGPEAALSATQGSGAGWGSLTLRPRPWMELVPGLRGEVFAVGVDGAPAAWAPVLAPSAQVRLPLREGFTGFLAYGRGYRSPDARGVRDGGRAPVAIADSAELGATVEPVGWLALRAAGFGTLVADEIVFDHVQARYLPTGRSRRLGVDTGVRIRPMSGLRLDLDLTFSDGRYTATGAPIPYAPRVLGVAGLYAERLSLGRAELTAGLRTFALGPRPLPDGFLSGSAVVSDLTSTVRVGPWGVSAQVDNVFGSQWRDGEFLYASWWDRSQRRGDLPVRHFTAGAPRAARLSLAWRF